MRIGAGSLEYAQARLSSRYGERPDEAAWMRIEHVRALPALLDAIRATSLGRWTPGIGTHSTPHEIDRALRARWRGLAAEVASWMPVEWEPAVRWCAVVVDLPLLQHLARGGAAPEWMREDAFYADVLGRGSTRAATPPPGSAIAPLAAAWGEPHRIGDHWLAHWRRQLPAARGFDPALIEALVGALRAHLAGFRDRTLVDGWPLRRAFERELALQFRRAILDPAAAFVYLALAALDAERLRGELARRALFPGMPLAS